MERAPLRPVPAHRQRPSDARETARIVAENLPALGTLEADALARVALAGSGRARAAAALGVGEERLGEALCSARKELRRTIRPLTGSGWCERAERLISDRLDGALAGEADRTHLEVHLRNCPRCVEHERLLVLATDALLEAPAPAPPGRRSQAALEVVPAEAPAPQPAAIPVPPPAPSRSARQRATAASWHAMFALAVMLALAALALALAGVLGANL